MQLMQTIQELVGGPVPFQGLNYWQLEHSIFWLLNFTGFRKSLEGSELQRISEDLLEFLNGRFLRGLNGQSPAAGRQLDRTWARGRRRLSWRAKDRRRAHLNDKILNTGTCM